MVEQPLLNHTKETRRGRMRDGDVTTLQQMQAAIL